MPTNAVDYIELIWENEPDEWKISITKTGINFIHGNQTKKFEFQNKKKDGFKTIEMSFSERSIITLDVDKNTIVDIQGFNLFLDELIKAHRYFEATKNLISEDEHPNFYFDLEYINEVYKNLHDKNMKMFLLPIVTNGISLGKICNILERMEEDK